MRAMLLALAMAAPALAGCLGPESLQSSALARLGFDPAGVVAEGAVVEPLRDAVRVVWNLEVPAGGKKLELTIPRGVTMVDARASWPEGVPGITMAPRESGPLRRCPRFEDLAGRGFVCRGLTVLDPLPATWTFDLRPLGEAGGPVPLLLEVQLTGHPLDGPAARLRLDQLSQPVHGILPTQEHSVEASIDGAKLYVQVTRPDSEGPVPSILISSPYNNAVRASGQVPYNGNPYGTIPDYVPRGYAVVVADVRGFGNSAGCVDVWGPKEQQDQYDLVEWVAAQPWSDGKVAMYGQSYVGTTPHEAAVMAPPHLVTIITVAGLTDAYYDWHFGGVPNGEQFGSPLGYEMIGAEAPTDESDRLHWATLMAGSYCDSAQLIAGPNDPRGVYDDFYRARNFSARADKVKVPVLYTQGYFDNNVKSQMAVHWFNDLQVPKKGLFGPWFHRHPPRPDQDLYFHAWLDQWMKGRDTGILDLPAAESLTLQGTWRGGAAWPPAAQDWPLHLDATTGSLAEEPPRHGSARYEAMPARGVEDVNALLPVGVGLPDTPALPASALTFVLPAAQERRYLSGAAMLDLTIELQGLSNTYIAAYLFERDGDARRPLAFGWRNAALRNSYERYEPVPAGERVALTVPLLPTEWVLEPGRGLELEVRAVVPSDWAANPTEPGVVTVHTGEGLSLLRLPVLEEPLDSPVPRTARVT